MEGHNSAPDHWLQNFILADAAANVNTLKTFSKPVIILNVFFFIFNKTSDIIRKKILFYTLKTFFSIIL